MTRLAADATGDLFDLSSDLMRLTADAPGFLFGFASQFMHLTAQHRAALLAVLRIEQVRQRDPARASSIEI